MRRLALRTRYLSIPTPLRRIGWLLMVVWLLNFVAMVVWASSNNACLRGHTEYPTHYDPSGDNQPVWVCDLYKTDQNRNPWNPENEFRTIRNWLTG